MMNENLTNLPALDGWVSLGEAAELLGISRQHAYRRAKLANSGLKGGWKTARRIGNKPMYVVAVQEVLAEVESKASMEEGE